MNFCSSAGNKHNFNAFPDFELGCQTNYAIKRNRLILQGVSLLDFWSQVDGLLVVNCHIILDWSWNEVLKPKKTRFNVKSLPKFGVEGCPDCRPFVLFSLSSPISNFGVCI